VSAALLADLSIFVLSLLVGFEVISKVPSTLHTPLMSAANSIHGIVLAGAMLIAVTANNALGYVLAFIAAAFAAANVTGGYVVTGRMLKMFRKRITPASEDSAASGAGGAGSAGSAAGGAGSAVGSAAGDGRAAGTGSSQP
jgi:NAD(P) transhydrogenase subunit alpha